MLRYDDALLRRLRRAARYTRYGVMRRYATALLRRVTFVVDYAIMMLPLRR